jgi:hypothetical protein
MPMSVGVAGAIPVMLADVSVGAVNLGGELDEQKNVFWEVENPKTNTEQGKESGGNINELKMNALIACLG